MKIITCVRNTPMKKRDYHLQQGNPASTGATLLPPHDHALVLRSCKNLDELVDSLKSVKPIRFTSLPIRFHIGSLHRTAYPNWCDSGAHTWCAVIVNYGRCRVIMLIGYTDGDASKSLGSQYDRRWVTQPSFALLSSLPPSSTQTQQWV